MHTYMYTKMYISKHILCFAYTHTHTDIYIYSLSPCCTRCLRHMPSALSAHTHTHTHNTHTLTHTHTHTQTHTHTPHSPHTEQLLHKYLHIHDISRYKQHTNIPCSNLKAKVLYSTNPSGVFHVHELCMPHTRHISIRTRHVFLSESERCIPHT